MHHKDMGPPLPRDPVDVQSNSGKFKFVDKQLVPFLQFFTHGAHTIDILQIYIATMGITGAMAGLHGVSKKGAV